MLVISSDNKPIEFNSDYILSKESYLYRMFENKTKHPIKKDSKGRIILDKLYDQLLILKNYLELSDVKEDNIQTLVQLLDFYGIYTLKVSHDTEFLRIKLREEWFRRNLYNDKINNKDIKDDNFRLINWKDIQPNNFKLATYLPFLSFKILSIYKEPRSFIKYRYSSKNNQIDILNDELNFDNDDDIEEIVSRYKTPNYNMVNISSKDLETKVSISEKLYGERNDLYGKSLLYSKPGKLGQHMSENYDTLDDHDLFYLNPKFEKEHLFTNQFNWNNVVVAGGSVLKSVMKIPNTADIDMFIYGFKTIDQFNNKVYEIINYFILNNSYIKPPIININKHTVTLEHNYDRFQNKFIKYQIILRAYTTKSEIIHGFDIDSSCILYDGHDFLTTERFVYALTDMVNTVDFDRMSPSYEVRLRKYNKLGFSIHIPNFDYTKIKPKIQEVDLGSNKEGNVHTIPYAQGIDLLLRVFVNNYKYNTSDYLEYYKVIHNNPNSLEKNEIFFNYKDSIEEYIIDENYIKKLEDSSDSIIVYNVFKYYTGDSMVKLLYTGNNKDIYVISERLITTIKKYIPLNWKITQPGDQFTGTFHQTVYDDYRNWYPGKFYPTPE